MQSDEHGPINLGNPIEIDMLELADRIKSIFGCNNENVFVGVHGDDDLISYCKSEVAFKLLPQDDPRLRQPDITKAKTLLGWSPDIGLNDGLRETIKWFTEKYI
jgi:nucleoside-diphosphate-sugar epimerase